MGKPFFRDSLDLLGNLGHVWTTAWQDLIDDFHKVSWFKTCVRSVCVDAIGSTDLDDLSGKIRFLNKASCCIVHQPQDGLS